MIRNQRDARRWVYHDLVAKSLRKMHAQSPGTLRKMLGPDVTPAGEKRVHAEMLRLAAWLEAKAAKLAMPQTPAGLDDDHALIAGDEPQA